MWPDLHSNNYVVIVSDENNRIVYQKHLPDEFARIAAALEPCQHDFLTRTLSRVDITLALIEAFRNCRMRRKLSARQVHSHKNAAPFATNRHLAMHRA